MTDKKLTDSEILKALECCSTQDGCKSCIFYGDCVSPIEKAELIMKNALDLINRLQEKDETRHKVFETKCEELEIAKAENERLQDCIDEQDIEIASLWKRIEEAKAESYKECIEKVKEIVVDSVYLDELDDLLKELVGDNNES